MEFQFGPAGIAPAFAPADIGADIAHVAQHVAAFALGDRRADMPADAPVQAAQRLLAAPLHRKAAEQEDAAAGLQDVPRRGQPLGEGRQRQIVRRHLGERPVQDQGMVEPGVDLRAIRRGQPMDPVGPRRQVGAAPVCRAVDYAMHRKPPAASGRRAANAQRRQGEHLRQFDQIVNGDRPLRARRAARAAAGPQPAGRSRWRECRPR